MKELKKVLKTVEIKTTTFKVGQVEIGKDFIIIAGPCAVESEEQIINIAKEVKALGANMLRGGAFKPRTSPYSFQGLGINGLEFLKMAGMVTNLPVITEVTDIRNAEYMYDFCDVIQIGARNMYNYSLLKEVGRIGKPVMLKRGLSATIEEFLYSAEYILAEGNKKVMLCERGIRTFESYTRNTLDLSCVAALKNITHLPIISDPSHATGRKELIYPMCLSSVMAGCDGLMIEVHVTPDEALSDSEQAITPDNFGKIIDEVKKVTAFKTTLKVVN